MTTEQFIKDMNPQYLYEETGEHKMYYACDIPTLLKEFARVHVEAALKAAAQKSKLIWKNDQMDEVIEEPRDFLYEEDLSVLVDSKSILNSYPLTNII